MIQLKLTGFSQLTPRMTCSSHSRNAVLCVTHSQQRMAHLSWYRGRIRLVECQSAALSWSWQNTPASTLSHGLGPKMAEVAKMCSKSEFDLTRITSYKLMISTACPNGCQRELAYLWRCRGRMKTTTFKLAE